MKLTRIGKIPQENLIHLNKFIPGLRTRKPVVKTLDGNFHFVYCILNLASNKFYFGKHSSNLCPKHSTKYHSSSKYLHNAIAKYGLDSFRMLIIKYLESSDAAYKYEEKTITQEMVNSEYCYNSKLGGKGADSEWTRRLQVKRIKDGNHNFLGVLPWDHYMATEKTKLAWYLAPIFHSVCSQAYMLKINSKTLSTMVKKICLKGVKDLKIPSKDVCHRTLIKIIRRCLKDKWVPRKDIEWKNFCKKYQKSLGTNTDLKDILSIKLGFYLLKYKVYADDFKLVWHKKNKHAWLLSDKVYNIWLKNNGITGYQLSVLCNRKYRLGKLTEYVADTMIQHFNENWIPKLDSIWIRFRAKELRGK